MHNQYIYRLGLDLGTSSIGWAIVKLSNRNINNPDEKPYYIYDSIIGMGSRIFSDGRNSSKTGGLGDSLAKTRRDARQARRQIDRKRGRRMHLFYFLQEIGLMPKDTAQAKNLQKRNPYKLRADGVNQQISLFELGRALFHLQQRRGFKSSRKDLQKVENAEVLTEQNIQDMKDGTFENKNSSPVKKTIANLYADIYKNNLTTVGQLLWDRFSHGDSTLCKKIHRKNKDGGDSDKIDSYENYFDRKMILDEFNVLWDKQAEFYPAILNQEIKNKIRKVIFFQRPLKTPAVGHCTYIKNEKRAALCLPTTELYRIWAEINNLELKLSIHNPEKNIYALNLAEKQQLISILLDKNCLDDKFKIKFTKLIQSLFVNKKEADKWKANLDNKKKEAIEGAATCTQLIEILGKEKFDSFNLNELDELVSLISQDKHFLSQQENEIIKSKRYSETELENFFTDKIKEKFNFTDEVIDKLNHIKIKDDYASLSTKAMQQMLEYLKQGYSQHEAKINCCFKDRHYDNPIGLNELPYYAKVIGEYCIPQTNLFDLIQGDKRSNLHDNHVQEIELGKITNPSVHIALNEVRKVVNLLLKKYKKCFEHNQGKPDFIHIELARDLCLGQKSVEGIIKNQTKNEYEKNEIKEDLLSLGIVPTPLSIEKWQLYKELCKMENPQCIYTGVRLPKECANFKIQWNDWEVDHILPRSRSFDDAKTNKLLVQRSANRDKSNLTPWEWAVKTGQNIESFTKRVETLPAWKQWKCLEQGVNYLNNNTDRKPQERLLNDTRYMARVTRMYLQSLYDEKDITGKPIRNNCVQAIPSGKITAHMRNEWKLNNLLWTAEQKEVKGNIESDIENLEIKGLDNLPEGQLKYLAMLKDIVNIPLGKQLFDYFKSLISENLDGLSDKEQENANKKYSDAKKKQKNRNDNRHHALDAVMIALADVSLVQKISNFERDTSHLSPKEKQKIDNSIIQIDVPKTLRGDLEYKINQIVVSHKPDHGTQSRLHEESARFMIQENNIKEFIYDKKEYQKTGTKKDAVKENSVIGIQNTQNETYKYYKLGSNYCYEIFLDDKGKYSGELITTYQANQKEYQKFMKTKDYQKNSFCGNKLIMRLISGDILKITDKNNKEDKLVYIQKINNGSIVFNEHFETNCDARDRAKLKSNSLIMQSASPASLIEKWKAKKVLVNPIGQVIEINHNK